MRHVLMALLFAASTAAMSNAAEPSGNKDTSSKESPDIGRYQLFQGTYTTIDLKYRQASSTYNAVFLLDTATGKVKRYVNRIDEDGRYIETWLPTDITQQMDLKKAIAP